MHTKTAVHDVNLLNAAHGANYAPRLHAADD